MPIRHFVVRRADLSDADQIALAHLDSIHSLGARCYPANVIGIWGAPRDGSRYRRAMEAGETFFVAVDRAAGVGEGTLGFSSHRIEDGRHRTAVYVRGDASRKGVGAMLFKAAEAIARQQGGSEIHVDASLVAVQFYRSQGFREMGRGRHLLPGGIPMDCVFMHKAL